MKRWPLVLAFLLTFAAGGAVGGFMTMKLAWKKMMFPPKSAEMAEDIIRHFRHDLDLSPEQIEKIRPLARQHAEQAVAFHHEIFQRIGQGMEELDADIASELTSEQKTKLAKIQADRRRHFPAP